MSWTTLSHDNGYVSGGRDQTTFPVRWTAVETLVVMSS
jgi:hypothetical protein